jgi:hypothetical protein
LEECLSEEPEGLVEASGPRISRKDVKPDASSVVLRENQAQDLFERRAADSGASAGNGEPSELDHALWSVEAGEKHESHDRIRSITLT